ncbi:ABC transporter, ferrichrome binding protein [Rivularia sp. IAM M-261]|nr:ABC transporter, ferrichrome binding protein [Rivularia sp. IAM M-261]
MLIVTVLAITACHSNTLQLKHNQISLTDARSLIETQIVTHALGKAKIPVKPQRTIVLHDMLILDSVLALGVKPVGVTYWPLAGERFRGIPKDLVANIPEVGSISQPSLEKIVSLKPDLILGTQYQKNYYRLLSAIAPTVLIDIHKMDDFKEMLQYISQILGKRDYAEVILTQYQQRIQQLQQQLRKNLKTITISVVALAGQNIYTYSPDSTVDGQIFRDIGLRRPLIQENQKEGSLLSSIEVLPEHDADVLFVIADWTKASPEPLYFLKKPIWSQLKAVQNNQVYEVNWNVGGLLGANRIIDDLFKYLVNGA